MGKHNQKTEIIDTKGGLFDILARRYSNGVLNLDTFLQCWSSVPINVDRKSGPPVSLYAPSTMCLNTQPEVLRGLARKLGLHGWGLLARFLTWLAKSKAGSREVVTKPVPSDIRTHCATRLRQIVSLPWAQVSVARTQHTTSGLVQQTRWHCCAPSWAVPSPRGGTR